MLVTIEPGRTPTTSAPSTTSRRRLAKRAARRLVLLLGIGLLHLTLVWWGDILIVHALLGLLALPCLGWPPRRVLLAALGLALHSPGAAAAIYAHGAFGEMLHQRALDYLSDFTPLAGREVTLGLLAGYGTYYAQLLGLFLLGLWAGQRGLHQRLGVDRAWTRKAWRLAAPVAVLLTGLRYGIPGLDTALSALQGDALALAYLLGLGLLLPAWPRVRQVFEAVGRLSLSAYLAHTILCSLLLYGTGLGLYGQIGPAALLPISLACYVLIAWGALGWSRRFGIGPAEWAWRSLLYGRPLPLGVRSQGLVAAR